LKEGERIFREDELLGGKGSHAYETCANPTNCPVHKDEYLRRNPSSSIADKIK